MNAPARTSGTGSARGIGLRRVRLASGLVLFAYIGGHFANHALGNVSLDAMEEGLSWHVAVWHSVLGTLLLYSALLVHMGLGLWALYARRHFRWKRIEAIQLVFGLAIPLLLAGHVVAQRIALELFGIERRYAQTLYALWVANRQAGFEQFVLVLIGWIHGCIGFGMWLRLKRFYPYWAPLLLGVAVLLPALALLGFYQGGRTIAKLAELPEWRAEHLNPGQIGTRDQAAELLAIRYALLCGWGAAIALVLAARGLRSWNERRGGMIRLSYPDGRTVSVPRGLSVLETSWRFHIPHASVCGGRGRCSTCRIRVLGDSRSLPPPSPSERAVLERLGVVADPSVRLACQLRPQSDIAVVPLLPPSAGPEHAFGRTRMRAGEERYIASLFVDMRGSTRMGEKRLPYDTVFVINRFLAAVSQAVTEAGGQPNQFLGDGLLALFGLAVDRAAACRQALAAAKLIATNVDALNRTFADAGAEPIRFGIGIHAGVVIVGDIGYRDTMVFTALGDAVNVAARLQEMTKTLGCEVILSDEVRATAGVDPDALPSVEIAIRGRAEAMRVRTVSDARMLPSAPRRALAA